MVRPGLCLLLLSCVPAALAAVPDYSRVQLQARSNLIVNDNGFNLPPGSSFNSISADIDDAARVSFPVQLVPLAGGGSAPGVWFGQNGAGALVYTAAQDALISSETSHNAAGDIVFYLFDTGTADGIYRFVANTAVTARLSTTPLFPTSYGSVRINDSGAVGYQAVFSGGRGLASTSAGSSLLHAADRSLDPGSSWTYLYTPDFNAQRLVFAKVATSGDFTTATEIRRFDSTGASVRMVANQGTDATSPIRQFDNGLAVNDSGVIAFIATRASDQRRVVYRSDGSTLTEIAAVGSGPITALDFFRPAISNAGLVVFRASDAGGQAIYASDGSTLKRVIGRADLLPTDLGPGQIGQNNAGDAVFSGTPAVNGAGDIAFIAALHPQGNNQIEWGTGVFVAYAETVLFADGFE